MLGGIVNRVKQFTQSGYDAIASTGKRKAADAHVVHEDENLKNRDRVRMISTGQYLARNYSILGWTVRRHLDYVTQHRLQVRTEDRALNEEIESLWLDYNRAARCDITGRLPLPLIIRMLESRRTLDGDVFIIKRSNGKLQVIEGDRVQQPDRPPKDQIWYNGIRIDSDGRPRNYAIHNRISRTQYKLWKTLKASSVIHHANFDRFDQVRGISPLACAFNAFQDVYEGVDYALAKLKVEQLFALAITSNSEEGAGIHEKDEGEGEDQKYKVNFGRGPIKLELENGDDAKFLMTDNPGSNTQEFLYTVVGMAMKSLDIPFSFFNEAHTNFFGSRASWLLYDRACKSKQLVVQELLRHIAVWRIQLWIQDRELRLPRGMKIIDIPLEFVPEGMPWWDPAKEVKGDLMAINAGLDNPYRVCKERGRGEYEENLKEIARAKKAAEDLGLTITFSPGGTGGQAESEAAEPEDSENPEQRPESEEE